MTVTKQDLTESICHGLGCPKKEAAVALESLMELLKATLASGEDVLISGFGKFSVNTKNPRRGRNPQSGNQLILDARRVVTFKPSGVLRSKLNGDG